MYWVTYTSPSIIIKTQPNAGAMTRVAALVGQAGDVLATAIAVDYVVHQGYAVFDKAPGLIVRYNLTSGADAPVRISTQTFTTGFNNPTTIVTDLGQASLLIGFNTAPGKYLSKCVGN